MSPANTCSAWLSEPAAIVVFKVVIDQLRIEAFELAGYSSKSMRKSKRADLRDWQKVMRVSVPVGFLNDQV